MNNHEKFDLRNLPNLGSPKPKVAVGINALPRFLNSDGTFDAKGTQNGKVVLHRDSYMDAGELLNAIRDIVREELTAALLQKDSE